MRKWYVVTHPNGWTVQDNPNGGGLLLQCSMGCTSLREAELICNAANEMQKIFEIMG